MILTYTYVSLGISKYSIRPSLEDNAVHGKFAISDKENVESLTHIYGNIKYFEKNVD